MAINYPDLVALKKINGSYTVAGVAAGGSSDATISLDESYFIVGVPKVSTNTADASVILINGGKNSFDVRVSNSGTAAADIVVDYEVYVIS